MPRLAPNELIFLSSKYGGIGNTLPKAHGKLAGAEVYNYLWPTNLNNTTVGFEAD